MGAHSRFSGSLYCQSVAYGILVSIVASMAAWMLVHGINPTVGPVHCKYNGYYAFVQNVQRPQYYVTYFVTFDVMPRYWYPEQHNVNPIAQIELELSAKFVEQQEYKKLVGTNKTTTLYKRCSAYGENPHTWWPINIWWDPEKMDHQIKIYFVMFGITAGLWIAAATLLPLVIASSE